MDEAAILLAGGTPGHRLATKHAFISVTQLVHDYHTHTNLVDANKLLIQSKLDNDRLFQILATSTGKPVKELKKDFDRRVFFNAVQAAKYGLIDGVIQFNK
jgi:ATP-dependent Clp protease protease subunit